MSIVRINEFVARDDVGDELYRIIASFVPEIAHSAGCLACRLVRRIDDPNRMVVFEEWADVESHKASAQNIPSETIDRVMLLLAGPPSGAYYE